jgi:hypothetical protein
MYAKLYYLSCGLHAILKKRKKLEISQSGTDNMTNKQQGERETSLIQTGKQHLH